MVPRYVLDAYVAVASSYIADVGSSAFERTAWADRVIAVSTDVVPDGGIGVASSTTIGSVTSNDIDIPFGSFRVAVASSGFTGTTYSIWSGDIPLDDPEVVRRALESVCRPRADIEPLASAGEHALMSAMPMLLATPEIGLATGGIVATGIEVGTSGGGVTGGTVAVRPSPSRSPGAAPGAWKRARPPVPWPGRSSPAPTAREGRPRCACASQKFDCTQRAGLGANERGAPR